MPWRHRRKRRKAIFGAAAAAFLLVLVLMLMLIGASDNLDLFARLLGLGNTPTAQAPVELLPAE